MKITFLILTKAFEVVISTFWIFDLPMKNKYTIYSLTSFFLQIIFHKWTVRGGDWQVRIFFPFKFHFWNPNTFGQRKANPKSWPRSFSHCPVTNSCTLEQKKNSWCRSLATSGGAGSTSLVHFSLKPCWRSQGSVWPQWVRRPQFS